MVHVRDGHAQFLSFQLGQTGLLRNLCKSAATFVVIKQQRNAGKNIRVAVGAVTWQVFATVGIIIKGPLQVSSDDQIQSSVIVNVHKCGTAGPSGASYTRRFRDIGELAVALIVIHPVMRIGSDVEILASIIVIVAYRHAHSISISG